MSRQDRLLAQLYSVPRDEQIDARKRRFDELNEFVSARGGWMTSVPGAREVTVECLPGSNLPDDLRARLRRHRGWQRRANPAAPDRATVCPPRGWITGAADRGFDQADRVDRDACGHRQGEAVCLQHGLTCARAFVLPAKSDRTVDLETFRLPNGNVILSVPSQRVLP
jgi:hypothetical protein